MKLEQGTAAASIAAAVVVTLAFIGCGSDASPGSGGSYAGVGGSGGAAQTGGSGGSGQSGGSGGSGTGGTAGVPPPAACEPDSPPTGPVYYVAVGGDDANDGSQSHPWFSITHAVESVEDGATILVSPGIYSGEQLGSHHEVRLDRCFQSGVTVRSEVPYRAKLRGTEGVVVRSFYGCHITLEGFDIAHDGSSSGPLLVMIQDTDPTDDEPVEYITIRNNVLHDSYDNDILKLNSGAQHLVVERNIFYNQSGSDEHIDVNGVRDVAIQDNIFFNDFEGSGRTNGNDTSSYIVIKDSGEVMNGARDIRVVRNVFLHWEGASEGPCFVLVGEDGLDFHEAVGVLVENNLMVGDSPNPIRAAFGVKSGEDITFRNNTVVGDLPSQAFAFRLNMESSSAGPNDNLLFVNNIWSDPTGTMERFSQSRQGETGAFLIDHNVYWNGGAVVPDDPSQMVNPSDDSHAIQGDPKVTSQSGVALPRWVEAEGKFADGSFHTCEAFTKLVEAYGTLGVGSAAVDAADPARSPDHDILGRPRGSAPDVGAVEAP